ncbi:fungal zn(2)-Cys(6) binuclear cluster domain-containing protein [Sarocladium implicatum]|nr:fungal zn(2)-Cys(6) binuclear cluster domain-containing protein [Sarocladium implicatum]
MFEIWKYDPETDEVQSLRRAFDPATARSSQHQACDRCHEKKLKCSGEKDGCERCIANSLSCEYTRLATKGSRRGKKSSPSAPGSTRGSSSTPSSMSPASPDRRRSSRGQQMRPSHIGSSSSALASQAAGERMLGQLEFPGFGPEPTLDLLPGGSSLSSRATIPTSPVNYTTAPQDPATLLAFDSLGSQAYPTWPASTSYGADLSTTTHLMPSYPATSGPDDRSFISTMYPSSSSYPSLDESQQYNTYLSPSDYTNLDPRFWPPSTQPGM